jgi:hypothetical protein
MARGRTLSSAAQAGPFAYAHCVTERNPENLYRAQASCDTRLRKSVCVSLSGQKMRSSEDTKKKISMQRAKLRQLAHAKTDSK